MKKMKRYFGVPTPLRKFLRSKVTMYGSQRFAQLRHKWAEQMDANRVAARRHTFDQAGGQQASIVLYGLNKARQKQ